MIHLNKVFLPVTKPGIVVNTTSGGGKWSGLSPFKIGPCELWGGHTALNMENAWQYSKVYKEHLAVDGTPNILWYEWAKAGWKNKSAVRYPMGKGAKPEYLWWNGEKLSYIEAKRKVYIPLYAEAVQKTQSWKDLKALYETGQDLVLLDYDVYETDDSFEQIVNNPNKKCGHGFVLKFLLMNDIYLEQCRRI